MQVLKYNIEKNATKNVSRKKNNLQLASLEAKKFHKNCVWGDLREGEFFCLPARRIINHPWQCIRTRSLSTTNLHLANLWHTKSQVLEQIFAVQDDMVPCIIYAVMSEISNGTLERHRFISESSTDKSWLQKRLCGSRDWPIRGTTLHQCF